MSTTRRLGEGMCSFENTTIVAVLFGLQSLEAPRSRQMRANSTLEVLVLLSLQYVRVLAGDFAKTL